MKLSVETVLGNDSMGEHEGFNMLIQWSDNALLRLDAFCYRWNFSSNEIIKDVQGASGVIVMKRVINMTKTDPQVLTLAISRQAALLGNSDIASEMIDDAFAVIKKVGKLQEMFHKMEVDENSEGINEKTSYI